VFHAALQRGAERPEVFSCRCQARIPIGATTHHIGILLILSVVLPETYGADVVAAPLWQGSVAATGAVVGNSFLLWCYDRVVVQAVHIPVEPRTDPSALSRQILRRDNFLFVFHITVMYQQNPVE
jgi:hypothetical protein